MGPRGAQFVDLWFTVDEHVSQSCMPALTFLIVRSSLLPRDCLIGGVNESVVLGILSVWTETPHPVHYLNNALTSVLS